MRRAFLISVLSYALLGAVWAQSGSGLEGVKSALRTTSADLMGLLPPLYMLLIVLAAIFYASGKLVPNPEFAGRAAGLAAAAVAASIISLVIVLMLPTILAALYPAGTFDCSIGTLVL